MHKRDSQTRRLARLFAGLLVLLPSTATLADTAAVRDAYEWLPDDACPQTDLTATGYAMSRVPKTDQASTGFCWAHMGVQLAESWRTTYSPSSGAMSSPFAASIAYLARNGKTDAFEGNSAFEFLRFLQTEPLCRRDQIGDYPFGMDPVEWFQTLNELYKSLRSASHSESGISTLIESLGLTKQGLSTPGTAKLREIAREEPNWARFSYRLLSEVCQPNLTIYAALPVPKIIATYRSRDGILGMKRAQSEVNELLRSNSPPAIGISFCPEIFFRRNVHTLGMNGRIDKSRCIDERGKQRLMHFAAIVGSRQAIATTASGEKVKICQYRIRNTYGTKCEGMPARAKDVSPNERCVNGDIWVDEDSLFTNTTEYIYLPHRSQ